MVGPGVPSSQERQPRLYVLVGLPGSGKSTYARRHLSRCLRVSLDDLRLMLSGRTFDLDYEPAVSAIGSTALRICLENAGLWGMDVVFDATNLTRELRARSLKAMAGLAVVPIAIFFRCPIELALARNSRRRFPVPDDVIRRFHAGLEEPTSDEGFAEVIEIDQTR